MALPPDIEARINAAGEPVRTRMLNLFQSLSPAARRVMIRECPEQAL